MCIFLITFFSNLSHSLIVFVGLFKRFGQLVELALYKLCYVMLCYVCLFVCFLHVVTCSQRLFYCCVVSLVLAVN